MTATPRFRTRGSQSPSSLQYEFHSIGPPPYAVSSTSGVFAVGSQAGSYQTIADVTTKGFRKTGVTSRWVANPLTITSIEARASSGSATTTNILDPAGRGLERTWSGDGVGYIFGALVPTPGSVSFGSYPDLVNVSGLKNLAVIGCLNRINPASSQSLVTAAESSKTVNTILDRARKLSIAWSHARKGDFKALNSMFPNKRTQILPKRIVVWDELGSPIIRKNGRVIKRFSTLPATKAKSIDSAHGLWLEYRYGWSPLVHDIVDQLKAINAQSLRDSLVKRSYTRVFERKDGSGEQFSSLGPVNTGGGYWTGSMTLTHKVSVKAYAKYQVESPSGLTNRLNDFGAFDVPKAIWELVPYSFIVDWFVPIGDWLGALQPKVGVSVIDSGVTVVSEKTVVRTLDGYTPTGSSVGDWPNPPFPLGASDGFRTVSKIRSIGLPTPFLPTPEVKLNFKRLVDAVALFMGARR